jgi:hypothetical protein
MRLNFLGFQCIKFHSDGKKKMDERNPPGLPKGRNNNYFIPPLVGAKGFSYLLN